MAHKYVYLFSEGNAQMRELLGGKGANLAEMTNIGLPVPQGFTITTEACTQYYEDGREINPEIMAEINEYIVKMEGITGKKFGDHENPLLVSVRSGARASMPGMMDTILNLGLNEDVVEVIAKKSGKATVPGNLYGKSISAAVTALNNAGFYNIGFCDQNGNPVSGNEDATVTGVSPTGKQSTDSTITLTVALSGSGSGSGTSTGDDSGTTN